jgi:hypothetical protein
MRLACGGRCPRRPLLPTHIQFRKGNGSVPNNITKLIDNVGWMGLTLRYGAANELERSFAWFAVDTMQGFSITDDLVTTSERGWCVRISHGWLSAGDASSCPRAQPFVHQTLGGKMKIPRCFRWNVGDSSGRCRVFEPIPKGLNLSALGCEERATQGQDREITNPERVVSPP